MLIHSCPTAAAVLHPRDARPAGVAPPTIAIVNGSPRALELIERTPEFDRYTLLFLNSRSGAYKDIKRLRPSLVVLSARLEDEDACRLLTILNLDDETRHIPVVTIATDDAVSDAGDLASTPLFTIPN
jgi:PleD family two-component response regulator